MQLSAGIENEGISFVDSGDFYQWLERNLHHSSKERKAEIVMLCWNIWKARNKLVWNQKQSQVDIVVAAARDYLEQWRKAQYLSTVALFQYSHKGDGAEKWVIPQEDTIKVDVDAATFDAQKAFGLGMLARNYRGDLIEAKTRCLQYSVPAEGAEVMAIKEALSWIK